MKQTGKLVIIALLLVLCTAYAGFAAYNHAGDTDSVNFRAVYPDAVGTKLDSCTLCHRGSSKPQDPVTYGSCQWCHYVTNYGATPAKFPETLNSYGKDYLAPPAPAQSRSISAIQAINNLDSDGDGYPNGVEIAAVRYPGDATDDPSKIPAPSRVISLKELEAMPLHTQFLLMNASKSDDSYTQYSGIALETLIRAIRLDSATDDKGITVYSPDGFATDHPFKPVASPNSYHVFGIYPEGTFYYNERADIAIYPPDPAPCANDPTKSYATGGWCDYSSPLAAGRANNSRIFNPEGLKLLLAFERDGQYLTPGELNKQNKLDGEGPFRVVPPQKKPGWPDQRSNSCNQDVIWPYDKNADHNAGFSSRTVTMIKVMPLPPGTTDINTMEAGWPYVDAKKIVIYGSIDPYPADNLNSSLDSLIDAIEFQPDKAFKVKSHKNTLINKIEAIKNQVAHGAYSAALNKLKEDILKKMDGCLSGAVGANDWIKDLAVEQELCAQIQQIWVMLVLLGA